MHPTDAHCTEAKYMKKHLKHDTPTWRPAKKPEGHWKDEMKPTDLICDHKYIIVCEIPTSLFFLIWLMVVFQSSITIYRVAPLSIPAYELIVPKLKL